MSPKETITYSVYGIQLALQLISSHVDLSTFGSAMHACPHRALPVKGNYIVQFGAVNMYTLPHTV